MNHELLNPIVLQGDFYNVREVNTKEGAMHFAPFKERGWCTSNPNRRDYESTYSKDKGDLYLLYRQTKKRPQAQMFLSKYGSFQCKAPYNQFFNLDAAAGIDLKLKAWLDEIAPKKVFAIPTRISEGVNLLDVFRYEVTHHEHGSVEPSTLHGRRHQYQVRPYMSSTSSGTPPRTQSPFSPIDFRWTTRTMPAHDNSPRLIRVDSAGASVYDTHELMRSLAAVAENIVVPLQDATQKLEKILREQQWSQEFVRPTMSIKEATQLTLNPYGYEKPIEPLPIHPAKKLKVTDEFSIRAEQKKKARERILK